MSNLNWVVKNMENLEKEAFFLKRILIIAGGVA